MFDPEYRPLTRDERELMNQDGLPWAVRTRLYARDLLATGDCYVRAADAVGLRKDAARYLYSEGMRLRREGMNWLERVDEKEAQQEALA